MGPDGVLTPGLLGTGQSDTRALEVELIRPVGIMFPENGVGAASLRGHAPCAFTVLAHGSMIGTLIALKSPNRSSFVGTVAVNGSPVRNRKPSQLANQKVRFRQP